MHNILFILTSFFLVSGNKLQLLTIVIIARKRGVCDRRRHFVHVQDGAGDRKLRVFLR